MIFVDTAAVGKGEDYGLDILGLLSNPTVQQVGGQLLNGMIGVMSGVGGRMGNMGYTQSMAGPAGGGGAIAGGLAGGVGGGGLGHLINEAVGAVNALGGVGGIVRRNIIWTPTPMSSMRGGDRKRR